MNTTMMRRRLARPLLAGAVVAAAATGVAGSASARWYEPVTESPSGAKACHDEPTNEWYLDGMKVLRTGGWYLCKDGNWVPTIR